MKKLLVFATFLVGISGAAVAQEIAKPAGIQAQEPAPVTGAIITFQESRYDFGQIRQGDVVNHTFTFQNTGTQPLIVSNVFTTCGCTVSDWTKTPVLPGKSGFVNASFNSDGKMGKQHKVLSIESNSINGNTTVAILTDIQPKDAQIEAAVQPSPIIETLAAPEKKTAVTTKTSKKAPAKKKKKSRR